MQINLTQKEVEFLKRVWNVEDPTPLIENLVRQHLEQLVNQELKSNAQTVEEKIDVIEASREIKKKAIIMV